MLWNVRTEDGNVRVSVKKMKAPTRKMESDTDC